jgi:hydroxymethylpyrimidine pyrophosphatase-like HAD family hydrolase
VRADPRGEKRLQALPFTSDFTLSLTEYEDRDLSILDVMRRGVTKGFALAEWAQRRGIRREEIMAIGDNWNDREMLEYAGFPVVMGNSRGGVEIRAGRLPSPMTKTG